MLLGELDQPGEMLLFRYGSLILIIPILASLTCMLSDSAFGPRTYAM